MSAAQIRIKLHFEGGLGKQLAQHGLDKCWHLIPSSRKAQTVADLSCELRTGFNLLGEHSDLQFKLDGFTVLGASPLSVFRDGDTVSIQSKATPAVPALAEGKKRKCLKLTSGDIAEGAVEPPLKKKPTNKQTIAAAKQDPVPHRGGTHARAEDDADATAAPSSAQATDKPAETSKAESADKQKKRKRQAEEPQQSKSGADAQADGPDQHEEEEEKKPSRSARRKALKRKCRRLGLAPAQAPAASPAAAASVSPALAAAAAASPFDPNAGLNQPTAKKQKSQSFRIQPVVSQPMKSHTAADGHVYFGGSSDSDDESDSESNSESEAHPEQPGNALGQGPKAASHEHQPNQAQDHGKGSGSKPASAAAAAQHAHKEQSQGTASGKSKLQHQQLHKAATVAPETPAGVSDEDISSRLSLLETDAENAALPAIPGMPTAGDIVAYRLLEIGLSWAPEVSEWRHGEVSFDEGGSLVISPLSGQGRASSAPGPAGRDPQEEGDEEEEDEEEEGPPTNYDENGVLTTDLGSLSELRLIQASSTPPLNNGPAATTSPAADPDTTARAGAPAAGKSSGPAEKKRESTSDKAANGMAHGTALLKLNALKPSNGVATVGAEATLASVRAAELQSVKGGGVPKVGAWAELEVQLQRRRAELGGQAAAASPSAGQSPGHQVAAPQQVNLSAGQNGNVPRAASTTTHAQTPGSAARTNRAANTGRRSGSAAAITAVHSEPRDNGMAAIDSEAGPFSTVGGRVQVASGARGLKPRGGVRASSIGPFLSFLRSSGGLDSVQ